MKRCCMYKFCAQFQPFVQHQAQCADSKHLHHVLDNIGQPLNSQPMSICAWLYFEVVMVVLLGSLQDAIDVIVV